MRPAVGHFLSRHQHGGLKADPITCGTSPLCGVVLPTLPPFLDLLHMFCGFVIKFLFSIAKKRQLRRRESLVHWQYGLNIEDYHE